MQFKIYKRFIKEKVFVRKTAQDKDLQQKQPSHPVDIMLPQTKETSKQLSLIERTIEKPGQLILRKHVYLQQMNLETKQFGYYLLESIQQSPQNSLNIRWPNKSNYMHGQNHIEQTITISLQICYEEDQPPQAWELVKYESYLEKVGEIIRAVLNKFLTMYNIKVDLVRSKAIFINEFLKRLNSYQMAEKTKSQLSNTIQTKMESKNGIQSF